MRVTCIHLLKIESDDNFYLLFGKKLLAFSKLVNAKFDPWLALIFSVSTAGRFFGKSGSDDGAGFKAALLSGPPGIGKTTTATLVC